MALLRPTIATNNGLSYATNRQQVTLQGTCDPNSTEVRVNGSTTGVSYTPGAGSWEAGPFDLSNGANAFTVASTDGVDTSPTAAITVTLLSNAAIALMVEPPTGLTIERGLNSIRLSWVSDVDQDISGFQVYVARSPGGGIDGFTKAHTTLISDPESLSEELSEVSETVTQASGIRTTTTVESVVERETYTFDFSQEPDGDPLDDDYYYFVVTAVVYDSTRRRQVESPYSEELFGKKLDWAPAVSTFPVRTFSDVVGDMVQKIFLRQPELDTKPLTFTRDVVIDPTSDEYQRLYTLLDFIHNSQSLMTLLAYDDPNGDGVSDDFDPGLQKTRLRDALLLDDLTTQGMINASFDMLATNYTAEQRQEADFARGAVTFYFSGTTIPDVSIPQGTIVSTVENLDLGVEAQEFVTQAAISVPSSQAAAYYNSSTRRYEFTVRVRARVAGAAGNVPRNSIITGSGLPVGFRVTNEESTNYGEDAETNYELAIRALSGVAGVDTGTVYGYFRQAVSTPGVRRAKVVDAGHPLMVRDYDSTVQKHLNGAVDVYVQGNYLTQVQFEFAFTYPRIDNEPVGGFNLSLLQFIITNANVTTTTPAFDILEVRNISKGLSFEVAGAIITGGVTVTLASTATNTSYAALSAATDQFVISYRFRQSTQAVFDTQPVLEVVDVQGSISGDLNDNYNLYRENDLLIWGNSTEAQDAIEIFPSGTPTIPSSDFDSKTDTLILSGLIPVSLSMRGVVEDTIVVTDDTGAITYTEGVDYDVVSGDSFTPPQIVRHSNVSAITDGQTVLVTYDVGENITVQYITNSLIQSVDGKINGTEDADFKDGTRHAAADVLVKSVLETPVDIRVRVKAAPGFVQSDVRSAITANLTSLIQNLSLGEALNQDEVTREVLNTDGVDRVELPISRMARQDEALVVREELSDSIVWVQYQVGAATAWQTQDPVLTHPTVDGGGWRTQIHVGGGDLFGPIGGFEDTAYKLTPVEDINEVRQGAGRIFIGADGRVTLSSAIDNTTDGHVYEVSYRVYNEVGPDDINADDLEVLVVGEISVEFLT